MYYNLNIYVPSFKYLEYKSRERNFFDVHIQSGNNACSSSTSNILEIKENCTSGYFLTWLTNQREMVYNPSFLLLLSVKKLDVCHWVSDEWQTWQKFGHIIGSGALLYIRWFNLLSSETIKNIFASDFIQLFRILIQIWYQFAFTLFIWIFLIAFALLEMRQNWYLV